MEAEVFTIQEKPDGKWILKKNGIQMGEFDTQTQAEKGMTRIITPTIYRYDGIGTPLDK